MRRFLTFLFLALSPISLHASPFCINVQGLSPDCIYDDTASCKQRAAQMGGACIVNVREITSFTGTEKFCMVDSARVPQCVYADRLACENAQNNGSVCVTNDFGHVKDVQADPFASDPNRNY